MASLLVAKEESLTRRHLAAVGAETVPVCVTGMADRPEFREVMLEGRRGGLDVERLRGEALGQVEQLAQANPDMGRSSSSAPTLSHSPTKYNIALAFQSSTSSLSPTWSTHA